MIEANDPTLYDELETMTVGLIEGNDFFGDPMEEEADDNRTRIYIQNLNGINWDKSGGKWPYVCEMLTTIQADIACFTELNTDINNYTVRTQMETICRRQFQQNSLIMSTSKFKSPTLYKPGGTAVLALNAITTKIKSHTRDRMGRWSSLCFTTQPNQKLRVISAYQVCHNARPGPNTAAAHQIAQIIEESATVSTTSRKTPRDSFVHDLQAFITQVQLAGEDIVLAGDFNEEMGTATSGMDRLAATCGLVDLFSTRTGSQSHPATYQRGTKRLDYILISPRLLPAVIAAGYDPFGYRLPSDHRGMYLDFSTEALFQQDHPELAPVAHRDFTTKSPETVRTYVNAKTKYMVEHRFFERLQALANSSAPNHELAESLDRDFQRAACHAAKKCTRRKVAPWCPKLAETWAHLHFYRLAKSSNATEVNYLPAIHHLQQKWPQLPRIVPTDPDDIQQEYNSALHRLKRIRQEAEALREEFLSKQANMYRDIDDKQKLKVLQRMIRAESQHKVYNKIKYLRNRDQSTLGLVNLKVPREVPITDNDRLKRLPDTPDHWETINAPKDIERLLLLRNKHHFSQAEGTPFTLPPLDVDIGYNADGFAADLILQNQYEAKNVSEATSLLIEHLQARTLTSLDGEITKDQVIGKLRKWDETTTTSPSGIHLGHYHCLWRDPRIPATDPESQSFKSKQECLLKATVSLLNYALKHSYVFQRWKKVVNVMLLKDAGNPRIHRLRVIHLYETDYNLLLAVKWRQAMFNAEDQRLLNDGLYGSRPGRSAHDPALIEVLQHEIYRMSMKSGINFDLDATSCYDRILTSVASISCRRLGMHPNVLKLNTRMLETVAYHVKTNLGVSNDSYTHTPENPIHGTGQGSGNSPTIWCFVCSALFDALEAKATGARFTTYDKTSSLTLHMIGFVDDCTQRVNFFDDHHQPSPNILLATMQHDVQLWNDLLWASGGALEQSKCSFHLIQTQWTNDGHPFLVGGTIGTPLTLVHQDQETPTSQKSNYTAHKTLGCFINPAYNHQQAWSALQKKNIHFSELLETNYFTRAESWTYYTSIYLPSMTYPLVITPLTNAQCDQLDARFLRSLLPRCGYNRNMSRAIRYAPIHLGGAGFKQMYIEQGILILQTVFKYLNSPNTTIGKLLLMTISWTQAFLGTSQLFLTDVNHPIPPVGPSFLLDLRKFLQSINGSIKLQHPPVSPLLRTHDRFIMDIALRQQRWKQRHMIQINSVRRYLQAQTLADITNTQGTRFLPQAINPPIHPTTTTSRISTFNQQLPLESAWHTWRRFLRTLSNSCYVLYQPLGHWLVEVHKVRHWPTYVYDPTIDLLYSHHKDDQYFPHSRIAPGIFELNPAMRPELANGYPTAVVITMGTLRPTYNFISPTPINLQSWTICAQQVLLHPWEYSLLQHSTALQQVPTLINNLRTCSLISCSDGSVVNGGGTYGFTVATSHGQRLIKCNGMAPGANPNSFRSEAYGVLATMRWYLHAFQVLQLPGHHSIDHYLDNQSVITRINQSLNSKIAFPNQRLLPEQDVIDEIVATIRKLPTATTIAWVKGHQDATQNYHQLTLSAQLNCEADELATAFTTSGDYHSPTVIPLPHTPASLLLHNNLVTGHINFRVREAASTPPLHRYLCHRFRWDEEVIQMIDWKIYSYILPKYQKTRTTLVKHLHAISPTGHIAHRNDHHQPHECPACNQEYEDNNHVILCQHASRAAWRSSTLQHISGYQPGQSDPYLLDILRDGVTRFHQQDQPPLIQHYPPRYHVLISCQNQIGWDQVYRGRWSKEWLRLQDAYHNNRQIRDSNSTSWMVSLGRLLIDQWFLVWHIRNEQRHGRDQIRHSQLRAQILHSQMRELYSYRDRVLPCDQSIFQESLETHLFNSSLDTLESWINTYQAAIQASATHALQRASLQNRMIIEYPAFNPIVRARQQVDFVDLPPG